MSGEGPPWLAAFIRTVEARHAARPWAVPLLLRASTGRDAWRLRLPDHGRSDPPADRRPFRIASVTKVYVAAALFRLAEQGRLDLDAPVADAVGPETAASLARGGYDASAITVDQTMRHAAGLRDHCFSDVFMDRLVAQPAHRWTRAEQVGIAMGLGRPLSAPGAAFAYSDTGYIVLGEVVERTFGDGLAQAVPALLRFDELGLVDTVWDDPARDPATLERQHLGGVESTRWDASFDLFGGGGLVPTLAEVDGFLRALFGGRVFERDGTLPAIFARRPTPIDDEPFGHNGLMFRGDLGGEDVWAHTGFWGVQAAFLPARDIVLSATFNRAPEQGAYGKDELLVDFAAAVAESGA